MDFARILIQIFDLKHMQLFLKWQKLKYMKYVAMLALKDLNELMYGVAKNWRFKVERI